MNITFRQLRLFLALAETGSVSAAARRMHVTQPTASMQLREVTLAVGMPLYEVISRRVHLTEAGQALARTAHAIAGEWDAFEQRVAGAKGLTSGRLRVAVVSTAKYFIPRLLGSFCKLHPQIDISLEILNRDHVITRLRSNLDDLYVMSVPPADLPLEDQILMPNPLVVIAASTHPLALRQRVTLAQLQDERFILREKGSGTRMATDAHLRQRFYPDRGAGAGQQRGHQGIRRGAAGRIHPVPPCAGCAPRGSGGSSCAGLSHPVAVAPGPAQGQATVTDCPGVSGALAQRGERVAGSAVRSRARHQPAGRQPVNMSSAGL